VHEMPWEPPAAASIVLRDLAGAEADLVRVELLLALKKDDIAEELLRRHGGRTTSESAAALGYLELSRRRFDLARAHFERAIVSGGAEAATYFEYAMLLRETGAAAELVESNLRKALERNPNHAEAHFLLGLAASQQDRHEDAMPHLERAAAILPRQSYFWHGLAMARHKTGRVEEARRAAWRAREAATTPQERERADAAIELTGAPAAAPVARKGQAVVVPESWRNRRGDSKVEGTLEHVDCLGRAARLRVRSGPRTFVLAVEQPDKVVLSGAGAGSFEFACGPQNPRPVIVEYVAAKATGATDGEVTAIDLK
ncbi:MAG: tetratricopeptide repeat protein, partial [Bryobacteraceae bacterium]